MLMVVFGAGASYDSAPSYPPNGQHFFEDKDRMPLANELFDNRNEFIRALNRFPKCKPIVPYLRNLRDGITVERVLQRLQDEAAGYPEGRKQLASVRYYLQFMLRECEGRWDEKVAQGVTNQVTLLDQIERRREPNEQVCLVTFNYDTMLEAALRTVGVDIQSISDYVASDRYKLIKLHGSVNWGRRVETPKPRPQDSAWDIAYRLINDVHHLKITRQYQLVDQHPIYDDADKSVLFPALAIPVESKLDFECPEAHLEALRAAIPQVDKLLVVGWRAAETPFLQLLATNLQQPLHGLVVAGDKAAAMETANRLSEAGVVGLYKHAEGGFTDFVVERQGDEFLSR
jgi:hypothetical protein